MVERIPEGSLSVSALLHQFVEKEALPGTGITPESFWSSVESIICDLAPRNVELLRRREEIQQKIDHYHRSHGSGTPAEYEQFLRSIGYLVDQPADFAISTENIDDEVSRIAGPQLVVPLLNARFAINAANARWGSLYDALYGTDAISIDGVLAPGSQYNPERGAAVVAFGRNFLDAYLPLTSGSHADAAGYDATDGLTVTFRDGTAAGLTRKEQLVGYRGAAADPEAVVLVHHGLHIEIQFDRRDPIGSTDPAGIKDIALESALTTIMDLEDSVAAVDGQDKVLGYRNWLQLMQGTLSEQVSKGTNTFTRTLNPDRSYTGTTGTEITLRGRSLMFIRQVGHLMTTDAILDSAGKEIPEGILDAIMTALGSLQDLRIKGGKFENSPAGSMYIVKPKMHGPDEVAFTVELFTRVEQALGLPPLTLKIGIMDEERRTTLNLKACIRAASQRLAFINTGFLDRTGDEIHTSMYAGPMVRKNDMRSQEWIKAYEDSNVDIGLACGLAGRAQIGKGMWASPDRMADMLATKIAQPMAGANCAWVPSPTAATLHATHYHQIDVAHRQAELAGGSRASLTQLLTIPLGKPALWSATDRQAELDNNIQSTLGYVVRWIDAGVGCSKVPDITGEPLMEDRATCRISSQHVSNWLLHEIVTAEAVEETLRRMAVVVDGQNAGDPDYQPMAPSYDGLAFGSARELLLAGLTQPSGYTEPILHRGRIAEKASRSEN